MNEAEETRRFTAWYPWLLTLFPILHLYAHNQQAVRDGDVPLALLAGLGLTTLLFVLLCLLVRDTTRSALVTTAVLVCFYGYGHVANALELREIDNEAVSLPATLLLGLVLVMAAWRQRRATLWVAPLNLASLALLVVPCMSTASALLGATSMAATPQSGKPPVRAAQLPDGEGHPDIYYIIADGYSSNSHLQRDYAYDNSAFTDALEALGFFVAYDSKSNYGATLLSLASTLNLTYLPDNPNGERIDDLLYLRTLIADSKVARFLIERGYTYQFMLSGYLAPSSIADLNIDFYPEGVKEFDLRTEGSLREFDQASITDGKYYKEPFYPLLLSTTLLRPLAESVTRRFESTDRPYTYSDARRFFATLKRLETVPDMPEATFTVVHLLEPHSPIQLDRNGELLSREARRASSKHDLFFAELTAVNHHLLTTVEGLLSRSKTPPIIILQGDHGSHYGDPWTQSHHLTHFEILNAYFTPGDTPKGLRRDTSPINTFQAILNGYFGTDHPELEVRLFDAPQGYKAVFQQIDVTDSFLSE